MKFNELLEEYMHGRIDAKKLYNCVRKEFMVLLENYKFRELEYLKIYPFLSELQDEDLYCEAILNERVREIHNVLNGKQTFIYDVWMKLERCEINEICQIWSKYREWKKISYKDTEVLQKKLVKMSLNVKTVEDVCWIKLLSLMVGLPTLDDGFYSYNLLYVGEDDLINLCEEIERIIFVLAGEKPVHILLKYVYDDFSYTIL